MRCLFPRKLTSARGGSPAPWEGRRGGKEACRKVARVLRMTPTERNEIATNRFEYPSRTFAPRRRGPYIPAHVAYISGAFPAHPAGRLHPPCPADARGKAAAGP
jgi:hypothetical protein